MTQWTWEGNYTLSTGREVVLSLICEDPDPSVGIMHFEICNAEAWDEKSDVPISDEEFARIIADNALYDRIDQQHADDIADYLEGRTHR